VKSAFEKVRMDEATSVAVLNRRLRDGIPFEWHHHPEYELTLTLNSRGHRLIGDHLGEYGDGDVVLVGPNLPHTWCSTGCIDAARPHVAIVAWFADAWATGLVSLMPELARVGSMLQEARRGIHFSSRAAADVRPLLEQLPAARADLRLVVLLQVLRRLADDHERVPLADPAMAPVARSADARLQKVLDHLDGGFARPVDVDELAGIACLSPSALHRLFQRHTKLTPISYVARLRIGRACAMLMNNSSSIAAVAERVGFRNLANFNRQFRSIKGVTPREFRALYRRPGIVPVSPASD
jgi:AraC-like DNA-binding protein